MNLLQLYGPGTNFRHFDVHALRGRGSGADARGMCFGISFCQTHKHVSETHHAEINNVLILRKHMLGHESFVYAVLNPYVLN